jgi:hypothetical protein
MGEVATSPIPIKNPFAASRAFHSADRSCPYGISYPESRKIWNINRKNRKRKVWVKIMMLGVSTAWKSEVWTNVQAIIEAILDLGIQGVELDYRLTFPMAKQILALWNSGRFSVISVHNYFPVPDGVPAAKGSWDFFSLSSPDKEERTQAVQYTIQTMEWARRFRARAVVLHLGKISMENPM